MKTLLKSSMMMTLAMCILMAISCKKETVTEAPQSIKLKNGLSVTPETPNPGGGVGSFVVQDENGDYVTAYGGGINFGGTFVYPLSVQSYQNGTPYTPFYYSGYSPANMISFTQCGSSFIMILGTVVGGLPTYDLGPLTLDGIQKYEDDIDKWLDGEINTMPHLDESIAYTGGNSTGLLSITGTFVLDTQSPTHVSVTNITYNVSPPEE